MIKELVPLRFVLILMIFFHHAANFAGGGYAGVAYFFVLSGFCMMLGYRDKVMGSDFSYVGYLKKRVMKILPLHWITLLVTLGIMLVRRGTIGNVRNLLVNVVLLQSWIPDGSVYFSYNAVSWYLSTALFAIIVFPILVIFLEQQTTRDKFIFGLLILVVYLLVAFRMPNADRHAMLYIHPLSRLLDFIVGMYMAYFYFEIKKYERIRSWALEHGVLLDIGFFVGMMALMGIAIFTPDKVRTVAGVYWLPIVLSLLCLMLGVDSKTWLHRILQTNTTRVLTQCSFSMMMWHLIVIKNITPLLGGGRMVRNDCCFYYFVCDFPRKLLFV